MKISQLSTQFIRILSLILKSIWLFFPGILFLFLAIFCFWINGSGKDMIVAFIDNKAPETHMFTGENFFRFLFFVATGFWVYVTWYFSRIISYIKTTQQITQFKKAGARDPEKDFENGSDYFDISNKFLIAVPRILGNACFLILELAILQSPVLTYPISACAAWIAFFILLIATWYIDHRLEISQNKRIIKNADGSAKAFTKSFKILLFIFCALILVSSLFKLNFIIGKSTGILWMLLVLLLLFHTVFIYYVNLRRLDLNINGAKNASPPHASKIMLRWMDYLSVPRKEYGYFSWFIYISIAGMISYAVSILDLHFSRYLTPFPVIILALTALLVLGYVATSFSVRHRLNLHFIIFIIALTIGTKETHKVRMKDAPEVYPYNQRPDLHKYLSAWLERVDTTKAGSYDIYFVLSNGGASRSGYWTAAVLGTLEDSSIKKKIRETVFLTTSSVFRGLQAAKWAWPLFFPCYATKLRIPCPVMQLQG